MRPWLLVAGLLMACGSKPDSGSASSSPPPADSGTEDDGPGCTQTEGELAVQVTVDGFVPANVDNYRARVRSGEETPIEVTLSEEAVAELDLEEGSYSVSAVALDGNAEASWIDFVAVLACARTEVTVDMAGFGR